MSDDNPSAFRPIIGTGRNISAVLESRAEHPDLWAAQWPDNPKMLEVRDRMHRVWVFYCHFPNAFFIPEDDMETILEAAYFESLDLVEFVMTLEEVFDIKIDDETARKIRAFSTYERFLESFAAIYNADYQWVPFSLPTDYFEESAWHNVKRHLPFTWTDRGLDRELRRLQATRPSTWPDQWADCDDRLIQLRDRVSQILVAELEWFDDAFIPQDRLEAVFHSRHGLDFAAGVLAKINDEFKSDTDFDFIISRKHTYEDFLKKLAETP